jgi:serine/threonine-protein kinase
MSQEYWQRLEGLFHEAAQMETQGRAEFLAAECADDPELRLRVESLVLSSQDSGDLLGEVIGGAAAAVSGVAPGERIGDYDIVRKLGEGGMGSVYLAVRADDEFRKQVAIKLMRSDFLHRSSLRRFRTERQILATLEHPGIARLLDGGATPSGAPYVVMEYVDGKPVDVFCRELGLSVREQLELFLKVADAVSYAHRNLVIHRDIKPDNVLVTAEGDPKLLDFGIAKLLDPGQSPASGGQTSAQTMTMERLMTPEFASPEQARGEAVTTQTDVYSLGAMLYKLLTGRSPLRITGTRAAEIEREISETAPQRPSLAAGKTGTWNSLGRGERRDLDTILLTALHKEPARRYATVDNMAADIRRFLDGFPVSARGDSLGYRTVKLVRRHPLATAALAAVVLMVVGFSVAMGVLAERARKEARTANEITEFLEGIFESNDPNSGRGDQVSARELLDRGTAQLDQKLKDEPAILARLYDTVGALYNDLGLSQKAEELLKRSIEVRRSRLTLDDDAAAQTLDNLGDVATDLSLYDDALRYYHQALAIHQRHNRNGSEPIIEDQARISSVMWNQGKFPEAEKLDRAAVASQIKLKGEDDLEALDIENDLGTVLDSAGRYAEAAQIQKQVLDRRLRLEPPNHPDIAYSWHNLSQALGELGRFSEWEDGERRALAVRIAAYGPDHPQVAMTRGELANVLVVRNKIDEALTQARRGFDREMQVYGADSRDTTYTQGNLARALAAAGKTQEALEAARRALSTRRKLLPAGHPKIAQIQVVVGEIERANGEVANAVKDLREALASYKAAFGPRHPRVADADISLAEALIASGDYQAAEESAREALAIDREAFPMGHPQIGMAGSALGWAELVQGHKAEALAALKEAVAPVAASYGSLSPQAAAVAMRLAVAEAANGHAHDGLELATARSPAPCGARGPAPSANHIPER